MNVKLDGRKTCIRCQKHLREGDRFCNECSTSPERADEMRAMEVELLKEQKVKVPKRTKIREHYRIIQEFVVDQPAFNREVLRRCAEQWASK